jgi:hypothetical protein
MASSSRYVRNSKVVPRGDCSNERIAVSDYRLRIGPGLVIAEVPLRWKSRIAMPRSVIEEQRSEEQRDEARKANGPLG